MIGISEEIFWYAEWSFLITVVENKTAVENWKSYIEEKESERR